MSINGWLLANRLKGFRVLAAGVESDGWLFVAPMMFVLYCSLNMVGLVLVSRGRLVGVARVMHPLGCTQRGGNSTDFFWALCGLYAGFMWALCGLYYANSTEFFWNSTIFLEIVRK